MLRQVIEVSGEGRHLSLSRGFLAISGPDGPLGQVPLDDIEAVIAASPAISYTNQALSALAERGTPVAICGSNFAPIAWLLPIDGHHAQGNRIQAQADASEPTRKRIWSALVRAKVEAQALALERLGGNPIPLRALLREIKSGDPGNVEALAAQRYFPAMFGHGFRRDRELEGPNCLLNYGYTVLRAATARAIIGAGLHPSLSVFHKSRGDALRLADDIMEPFRPAVDLVVAQMTAQGGSRLDPAIKRHLAHVLHLDYTTTEGRTPLTTCLVRLCVSLAQIYTAERQTLALPKPLIPLAEDAWDDTL